MIKEFITEVQTVRAPGEKRPVIQTRARYLMEHAPNPYGSYTVRGQDATRMPGRGVSGESTN